MNRAEKRRQIKMAKKAAKQPSSKALSINLAMQFHKSGDLLKAENIYQQILKTSPNEPEVLHLLGTVTRQLGKNEAAVEFIQKAVTIKPDFADAHFNLGNIFSDLGKFDKAIESYQNVIAATPKDAEAFYSLGNAQRDFGKLDRAVDSYQSAISINPQNAEVHYNLGNALVELGMLDEAVVSYQNAINRKPDFVTPYHNIGKTFQKMGRLDEAVASYRKAINREPNYAEPHHDLGDVLKVQGHISEAISSYHSALAIKPNLTSAHSDLLLTQNYNPDFSASDKLEEARRYDAMLGSKMTAISGHPNVRDPKRRLKIGFVSGDFRRHSVSHFLLNILPRINADDFELFAYYSHNIEDEITVQLRKSFSVWREVMGNSIDKVTKFIVEDEIDILIDLSGHSANTYLPLFSKKPAPVQVTWLGYSGTTGVGAIDYILCDRWVIPTDEEEFYTEEPWRLPDGYLCFSPPEIDIPVDAPASENNSYITFGSFNNLSKMSAPTVACWAELLHRVPESRLFLKTNQLEDETVKKNVWELFTEQGIEQERIILSGTVASSKDHLSLYNKIDIALDPFPYCGTTTTAEALCLGVPVVTMRGQGFVTRVGESILKNIGREEWIAENQTSYVETAMKLAATPEELSATRRKLREDILTSPLCDAPRFARNFENALRGMWTKWCLSHI